MSTQYNISATLLTSFVKTDPVSPHLTYHLSKQQGHVHVKPNKET